jgi:hypothetical protein
MEWTEGQSPSFLEVYRHRSLWQVKELILHYHPTPGAILDIGSNYGNLLAQLPDTWEKTGVDPSFVATQVCRERLPNAKI